MRLYYAPGFCSLAPHIALREAGFTPELVKVDLRTKKTESGDDYWAVNHNGYVPTLALDDGSVLTEVSAILQFIADQVPERKFAPPNGTLERYRLQSLLSFISAELHKSFGVFVNPHATDDWKEGARALIGRRLNYVNDDMLAKGPYAMGEQFTVADAYLFTCLNWSKVVKIDLEPWPRVSEYLNRIGSRPAVQEALRAEGLM